MVEAHVIRRRGRDHTAHSGRELADAGFVEVLRLYEHGGDLFGVRACEAVGIEGSRDDVNGGRGLRKSRDG